MEEKFTPFLPIECDRAPGESRAFDLAGFMREFASFELAIVKEKKQIPSERVIAACAQDPVTMQTLFRAYPNFHLNVARADWMRRFETLLYEGNRIMRREIASRFADAARLDYRGPSVAYQGAFSEYFVRKLFEKSGFFVAHARSEIDAACGVDLLGFKNVGKQDAYFAIQIKTAGRTREVSVNLVSEEYLDKLRKNPMRSDEEDKILRGAQACTNAARNMSRVSGKIYYPIMITVPPLKITQEWVDPVSFEPNQAIIDAFRESIVL